MQGPLISVITVVYNGARTLEATIESVVTQTYPNIEFIIVDGGSKDETLSIIKKYQSRITRWISEKDEGIYDAMNKGIDMAKGDYLIFMGSDDVFYTKEAVAEVFAQEAACRADLVYGNVKSDSFQGVYDGRFDLTKLLDHNICHQAIFYRKELFQQLGKYNKKYKALADWEFNIRCFLQPGIRLQFVDQVIAQFGVGGVSAQHDPQFLRDIIIPEKLRLLNEKVIRLVWPAQYDGWWRLIRNAAIRTEAEFNACTRQQPVPKALRQMVRFQQGMSPALLQPGIRSKISMMISYIKALISFSL
ncbi:glycosyltransferase family 2 protein [Longitalea arenae]|uniref:glycosyltransferase family 2 protein n=1 Tax=Longitalea arenae TaxID=2812558 RepID=UPI001968202C|nr:glycosyltransferase family 2 protein [Longitalea arenae]